MPFISINFNSPINISCQPGDKVYSTNVTQVDVNNNMQAGQLSNSYFIGNVYDLVNSDGANENIPIQIIVEYTGAMPSVGSGDFLMFSKNKLANTSGITGYYADVEFTNDSREKVELFSVSSSIALSSQ